MDASREAPGRGRALVLLGALALVRASCSGPRWVPAEEAGRPVAVRLGELRGEALRLLPGVGPVLAGRLEEARVRAGGRLDAEAASGVSGVGPGLLARWREAGALQSGLAGPHGFR